MCKFLRNTDFMILQLKDCTVQMQRSRSFFDFPQMHGPHSTNIMIQIVLYITICVKIIDKKGPSVENIQKNVPPQLACLEV
jgi:hypothetical protein